MCSFKRKETTDEPTQAYSGAMNTLRQQRLQVTFQVRAGLCRPLVFHYEQDTLV